MCLAIPARIVEVDRDAAKVDFGEGVLRDINVALVEANVDDYVLVHAGYAIQVISREEAQQTLQLWREILSMEDPRGDGVV
jgi:hydrogenase expression/formation protein HypC